MKKLMMAVAIVCAAAFAHAGVYTWGLGNDSCEDSVGGFLTESTTFTVALFIGEIGKTANGDGTYSLDFKDATYVNSTSTANGDYTIGDTTFSASITSAHVDNVTPQGYSMLVIDSAAGVTDFANFAGSAALYTSTSTVTQDPASSTVYSDFIIADQVVAADYFTVAAGTESSRLCEVSIEV